MEKISLELRIQHQLIWPDRVSFTSWQRFPLSPVPHTLFSDAPPPFTMVALTFLLSCAALSFLPVRPASVFPCSSPDPSIFHRPYKQTPRMRSDTQNTDGRLEMSTSRRELPKDVSMLVVRLFVWSHLIFLVLVLRARIFCASHFNRWSQRKNLLYGQEIRPRQYHRLI